MREDGKIDYVEFPATGIPAVKAFYSAAFAAVSQAIARSAKGFS